MKKTAIKAVAAAAAISLTLGMAACSTDDVKNGADKAASAAKDGADKAGDAAKDGAAKAKEGADKAADAAKDGADKAADAAKDGADKAKDGADKAADAAKNEADKLMGHGLVKVTDAQGAEIEIPEAVKTEWEKYGAAEGHLGAITDVTDRNGEDFIVNTAGGQSIVSSPDTGAVVIQGMIKETWMKEGAFEAAVGLPTAPESADADGAGWTQQFQNGTIQWTNAGTGEFHAVVDAK